MRPSDRASAIALAVAAAAAGCVGSGDSPGECVGDIRPVSKIFNGTASPVHVPLGPGQVLAIGEIYGCSGTLIAERWVLTARHCEVGGDAVFCMGDTVEAAECVAAARVIDHEIADLTLVELVEDASARVPGVVSIAIGSDTLDMSWIGETAEAAGYGSTETDAWGRRHFVTAPIVGLPGDVVTVDGQGARGTCFGDSGGPVMVVASDGRAVVVGALSGGHSSCVGRSDFTRTDLYRSWIESHTGPGGDPGGGFCGDVDALGRCMADDRVAMWCDVGQLRQEVCADATRCGWSPGANGFRCTDEVDPCRGHDAVGGCEEDVAYWCEAGRLRSRDCARCGQICSRFASPAGAYCRPDPCMGLDFLGRCDGDVARWCEGDQLLARDCAATGQSCGFLGEDSGYFCM